MKYYTIALFLGAISATSVSESSSDDEYEALMLESISTLNQQNESRAWSKLGIQSHAALIGDIEDTLAEASDLVEKKEDPNWETLSLKMINSLQDPVHNMVLSWNDWYNQANGMGQNQKWDPAHNPAHLVRSEVSDIYKAMGKIRMLEKKLKKDGSSGTSNFDWNLLNSLKREVGIPVEFAGDKKALLAEGDVPSTAVAALN